MIPVCGHTYSLLTSCNVQGSKLHVCLHLWPLTSDSVYISVPFAENIYLSTPIMERHVKEGKMQKTPKLPLILHVHLHYQ